MYINQNPVFVSITFSFEEYFKIQIIIVKKICKNTQIYKSTVKLNNRFFCTINYIILQSTEELISAM